MTHIENHNGQPRYVLTDSWHIGSNLQPTVKVGDDSTVSVWVHEWPNAEGRISYGYEVRESGRTVAEGTDLSGPAFRPDLTGTLASLLGFASYYAESMDSDKWTADPLSASDAALGRWYSDHETDLFEFQYDENGDEPTDEVPA